MGKVLHLENGVAQPSRKGSDEEGSSVFGRSIFLLAMPCAGWICGRKQSWEQEADRCRCTWERMVDQEIPMLSM